MSNNNLNTKITIKLNDLFSKPMQKIAKSFASVSTKKPFLKTAKDVDKTTKAVTKLNRNLKKNKDLMGSIQDIAQVWASSRALKMPFTAVTGREEVEFGLGTLTKNLASFKNLSRQIGNLGLYSYNDTMEEFYALISGGFSEDEAKKSAKQVQLFAKATRSSLSAATDAIIGAVNVSGVSIEKATDVFTKVQYKYKLNSLEQLVAGFANVGAIAKSSAKLGFVETNVLLGVLNSNMKESERAGTSLTAVLRNLPRLQKAGITVVRDKQGNLDIVNTLKNIKKARDSITGQENKNYFLQQIFGEEGVQGITPLLDKISEVKQGIIEVSNSQNLAKKEGTKWQKSLSSNLLKLSTSFANLGQTLGITLVPALINIINGFAKIINGLDALIKKVPIIGQLLFNLGVAFLFVKSVSLAKSLLGIGGALNIIKLGIRGIVSSTGLGLLLTIGLTIYEQWDNIVKLFKKIMDWGINSKIGKWAFKKLHIENTPKPPIKSKHSTTTIVSKPIINITNNGNSDVTNEVIKAQHKVVNNMQLAGTYGK